MHVLVIFIYQFIRRLVSKARSPGAVNVVHEQGHVFLCVGIQGLASGDYIPDELMIFLNMRFLLGSHRITEEQLRSVLEILCQFKARNVPEFSPVVRENDGKQALKSFQTKASFKIIKYPLY